MTNTIYLKLLRFKYHITKIIRYWQAIPRKPKTLLLFFVIILMTFLLYTFSGSPSFSLEDRYRRAEKAHMVGPAEILDIIELEDYDYEHILLADDGEGIIMYTLTDLTEYVGGHLRVYGTSARLIYRDKQSDIAVFPAPRKLTSSPIENMDRNLPIFLLDNIPEAVRAELDIEVDLSIYEKGMTQNYSLEARREKPGYFQFSIYQEDYSEFFSNNGNYSEHQKNCYAMEILSCITENTNQVYVGISKTTTVPVTVRLYDVKDTLLHEETITILTEEGEAHAERGELPDFNVY